MASSKLLFIILPYIIVCAIALTGLSDCTTTTTTTSPSPGIALAGISGVVGGISGVFGISPSPINSPKHRSNGPPSSKPPSSKPPSSEPSSRPINSPSSEPPSSKPPSSKSPSSEPSLRPINSPSSEPPSSKPPSSEPPSSKPPSSEPSSRPINSPSSEPPSSKPPSWPNDDSRPIAKIPDVGRPHKNRIAIIAVSVSAALVVFCLLILIFLTKFSKTSTEDLEDYIPHVPGMPVMFTHEELCVATRDFKDRLGGGGFGSVFKGVLPDGTEIAVKRLHKKGRAVREFLAEVETIGSIHHFNLVRLVGFSVDKSCLLVYEYMSHGSLDNWIFSGYQKPFLDWETRKKITLQIAKGLAYLHEECRQRIIHLDIKPQNILLDANFNAKISDFGLSKLVDRDYSQVLINLRGTPGYIAPELGHSEITTKVDIYSFGIVLLEIVSGRKKFDETRSESSRHLLTLLHNKAREDKLLDIVDNLNQEMPENGEEMLRMIRTAAWCLQNDPTRRPLMSTVVKVLEGLMEVVPNISYEFTHATGSASNAKGRASATIGSASNANGRASATQQASVLSNPR